MEQLHSLSALDDEGLLTRLGRRVSSVGCTLCNTQFCGITVCTSMQTDECERFGEGNVCAITPVAVTPCALSCNQLVTLHSFDHSNNALELYAVSASSPPTCMHRWQSSLWSRSCPRCSSSRCIWAAARRSSPSCPCCQCRTCSTAPRWSTQHTQTGRQELGPAVVCCR